MQETPRYWRWFFVAAAGLALSPVPSAAQVEADEAAAGATAPDPAAPDAAATAFDRLKALEGIWRVADRDDHPLRIRFYLTAGGKTLVEAWEVKGRSHSLTLYHRDGDALLATHYCPQGNQPRMALAGTGEGRVAFTFRDVTDYDAASEQHQHDLAFDLMAEDRMTRSEIYHDGEGKEFPSKLELVRLSGNEAGAPAAGK